MAFNKPVVPFLLGWKVASYCYWKIYLLIVYCIPWWSFSPAWCSQGACPMSDHRNSKNIEQDARLGPCMRGEGHSSWPACFTPFLRCKTFKCIRKYIDVHRALNHQAVWLYDVEWYSPRCVSSWETYSEKEIGFDQKPFIYTQSRRKMLASYEICHSRNWLSR